MPSLLGLDVGTSSIKAAVLDLAGRVVGSAGVPTPFRVVGDGSSQMAVPALLAAVDALLAALGPALPEVVGVGVASLGESGGWVRDGEVVDAPVLVWHDPAGQRTADALVAARGADEVLRRTGRQARAWTSLSKIGWLAEQGLRPAGVWTGVAGLVAWHLTGVVAQEPSLAATSGAFDPRTGRYDDDLVRSVGLSVAWAPVQPAGTPVGTVTRARSSSTGLRAGVPVTLAGHDHPVGVVGAGGRPGMVVDSMGTGEPLLAAWPADAGPGHPALPGLPGHLTLTAWPGEATLMLLWEHLRPGLALRALAGRLGRPRDELERAAVDRPDRTPLPAEVLLGLEQGRTEDLPVPAEADPAQTWADALAGYADAAAAGQAGLRRLTGASGPTLLIGGGVRSPRWVRAKRQRQTHGLLVATDRDTVARGAALLGGIAAGCWPTSGLPRPDLLEPA